MPQTNTLKTFAEVMYDGGSRREENPIPGSEKSNPAAIAHTEHLQSNDLRLECRFSARKRLETKIESYPGLAVTYDYQYDQQGHLLKVFCDGSLTEQYQYSSQGQRLWQQRRQGIRAWLTEGHLYYDPEGRLLQAGDTYFSYDQRGALAMRSDLQGRSRFAYGRDTALDKVILPSGAEIHYEYDPARPINPRRKFKNQRLTAEYEWLDGLRLKAYRDHEHGLEFQFSYNANYQVDCLRLRALAAKQYESQGLDIDVWEELARQARQEAVHDYLNGRALELRCGCDQVGALKLLTDARGQVVKMLSYDSFGNITDDTWPQLFVPLGFAGGLVDRDTGLVRFGWRDYDPTVGRFTAPDPLGDTGGDHDLYDYCVDDPVNLYDPSGLLPVALIPLLILGAKAVALGVAAAGSYSSAKIADKLKGGGSTAAVDAIEAVAPGVALASAASAAPSLGLAAPALGRGVIAGGHSLANLGLRGGTALAASTHGDKVIKAA